jgi:UPF0716 protein FxsA
MRRLGLIVAALIIVPIIEIAILIGVGKVIGVGWTLGLMLATSVLGGWLLRRQGGRAWRAFRADVNAGRPPGHAATDGLIILFGGIFMLVPGFFSDVIGLVLLLPPSRLLLRGLVARQVATRLSPHAATSLFGPRRVRARTGNVHPGPWSPPTDPRPDAGNRPAEALEGEIIDPDPGSSPGR